MKATALIILSCFLVSGLKAQTIYTSDGTLAANRIVSLSGKNLTFNPSTASSQFFLNGTSGFVGLGTSSPTSRFHLASGDAAISSGKLVIGTVANYGDATNLWGIKSDKPFIMATERPYFTIQSTVPGSTTWLNLAISPNDYAFSHVAKKGDIVFRGYTAGSMIFNCEGSGDIKFTTMENNSATSKVQMLIDKNGNVGIGTHTPDAKLAVNGLIHTKEVKVDLIGWPDYVFEEDYKLPTLQEVEQHIKENGHLKDIPSANKVEADGVKLGEMNKMLLQKVEELTLYIIQMNKELEEVKSQLKKN